MVDDHLVWTAEQSAVIHAPPQRKVFVQGPAGFGKTTAAVARMLHLLESGLPGERLLVLTPQRTLADPYAAALRRSDAPPGGVVTLTTMGGLARRMVDLFWPLVVEEAGFGLPDERPIFLTLETAQYYMARVAGPLIEREGYFESINIDRNRLYSQLLDNLNKAAVVGFEIAELVPRLKGAWVGEQAHAQVFEHAELCALAFRRYCLAHNLLDFSLQMEVFARYLWSEPLCRDYLQGTYTHLIVDNVEEDTPVAHDLLSAWLPHSEGALVITDAGAGYRVFLGAAPEGVARLRELCDETVRFSVSFVTSPALAAFGTSLARVLARQRSQTWTLDLGGEPEAADHQPEPSTSYDLGAVLRFAYHRFHPEMLDWVAQEIADLVHGQGVAPSEIVVLSPYLSDALRFSLTDRLAQLQVPARSHRPSRALREEPAAQTLLTLAALAHPDWRITPSRYDVAYALVQALADLDLIRAQLLVQVLYRVREGIPTLLPFEGVKPEMQQRITFLLGERYEAIRLWLQRYVEGEPTELDHFLARMFGEVLSQPGFGFHADFDAARVASTLIESVRKFRWVVEPVWHREDTGKPVGREYLDMVRQGVIAAQYLEPWRQTASDAVLLAPAYTFLLSNRPVEVQFWLNVGSQGWWERLYQPLTHPHVLSRRWPVGKPWTDREEVESREQTLTRLALGLVRRCRSTIYLGLSELGEQGFEQEGPLLKALQRVLRENAL